MIHMFNRAELMVTYDLSRLYQVCEGLADAGIDYIYRTKDLASPTMFSSRGHVGTCGINHDARVEYKIYTRREDVGRARAVL